MSTANIPISMVRASLDQIPSYPLPAPYSLRWYQPGDEVHWVAIHQAADPFLTFTAETFKEEFEADRALLPTRQAYLCDGSGTPVGTASAWFYTDEEGDAYGLVHWVAIHPAAQGQGLAKPLLSLICQRLHILGHQQAYLNTSTGRIPAINLYLNFGFVPKMRREQAASLQAWHQVRTQLTHPAVAEFLAANETASL